MACRRSTTPPPRSGRSGWSRSSCRSAGGSLTSACAAVGSRLGLPKDTVRGWCRREGAQPSAGDAFTSAEREEIKALKAKVRRLEEDNAILQSAATFFAGALDPRNR